MSPSSIDPRHAQSSELRLAVENRARVVMAKMLQAVIENPLDPHAMEEAARVQRLLTGGIETMRVKAGV